MNSQDFERTAPNAIRLGPAILRNYRLGFTRYSTGRRGGVADIIQDSQGTVEGILWLISDAEMPRVDAREGALGNIYRRIPVKLDFLGEHVVAYSYEVIQKNAQEMPPSAHYANLIVTAAVDLSNPYQEWLHGHITRLYEPGD